MTKKFQKKPLALTLGAAVAATLSAGSIANAETNPFGMSELPSGYMQLAEGGTCGGKMDKKAEDAKCGDGKCGGDMKKGIDSKAADGKCSGDMKEMEKDGSCAGEIMETKKSDGKCGEGKCGEGQCGGEGKCGGNK